MRGELYVTYLIHRSPLARGIANERRDPNQRHDDILDELRDPTRLSQAGPKFQTIAERLQATLEPQALRLFTSSDLRALSNMAVWRILGTILGCDPHQALIALLDPVKLQEALEEAQVAPDRPDADSQHLLWHLIDTRTTDRVRVIQHCYAFNDNGWGAFMTARQWILPGAAIRLRAEASRRGWIDGSLPVRLTDVLAALVTVALQPPAWQIGAMEDYFDSLAVVAIRRRVAHLVNELRREASDLAELAARILPGQPGVVELSGWLDLYERQSVIPGLLRLLGGRIPLVHLLNKGCVEPLPIAGDPDLDAPLAAVAGRRYTRGPVLHRRQFVNMDVRCPVRGFREPQTFLRIVQLPADAYPTARTAIEQLSVKDLIRLGPSLAESLLATFVTTPDRLTGLLRRAVERHIAAIAQTVALCGINQPIKLTIPWQSDLRTSLPYTRPDGVEDVAFPNDIDAIVAKLRDSCRRDGKHVTVQG